MGQRTDIYDVLDKDGNVVGTVRYPEGGSLYAGAKSNREAGASNIVYGGTGEQEDYEPLFTKEDVKAATSISINKDTGKITVKAPKMVTESESFKQAINQDVLKQASQAYKLNKDYKLPYDEYDKETGETKQTEITIPEYISKINESVKSLASDIVTARYLRSYYAKNLNEKAANLSDAQVQMSTDFKNGVIPIPEFLHSINGFRNIDKYLQDGYIKEDDFRKNFYNRDNLDREDMAALMAILNTALKTGSWSKDEYYEGEDGEQVFDRYNATEMAKAIALRDYILSKDPDQTWLQSVVENYGTFGINALYGADRVFFNIANVGQKVTTFGQGNEMQNYIKDMDKAFGEYNEEGKLINDATAVTSWLGVIGGSIAGSWAAGRVAGSALEYVGGKVGAAYTNAYNSTMEGAMKAAGIKKGAATTKAIADGTLTQGAVLAMAAENGYEIAKGAAFVVKMMPFVAKVNLVNNLAHAYLAQHATLNFAVKFLMDTFHDALVFDSTTLFDALQSSDQETRNYWMGQLVDNGKWWIGMAGARGLVKFSGKTVIGQWLNAHSTKLVNKFEAWAGDKWTNFKDRINGGSLVRKLQGKLDEALEENKPKKARRLKNKIEQLEFNEQLRNARRELGNIELETKPGSLKLTDESMAKYLEQTNAVRAMNVSVDAYNRSIDYKRQEMMGAIDDPYTGQKNLYINPSLAGKNTKVSEFYFELMRMNDAAGLGRGAHNSAISQEVTDYWMGKRTLDRYSGLQGQDAQDAAEQAAKNLEAYASKVPENIRRYIDENAHLYAEFYSEFNEYGVSKKLLDKNRIEGYNNETWKNIGGYEPIVELSESAQKGNVRLDTGGDVAAVIDQEMRELTYKVGDTPHYVDPELIRQSRINRMAQAEINRSMLDNYAANAGAAFSDFVTGDETEYARLIAEGRKTVKKAVDEATVNFVEDFPVNLAEASKMPKKSTKAISGARRAKIADNMTFADTSDALTDLGVIYSGERYMTDGVDASNFDDWYRNTLNENARNYLGNALADYGPSYKANMQRKAEISSLRSAISKNESRIAKRFPYRDAKVTDLDGYFKSSDSKQAFTDKLYALPKDTAQELLSFADKRLYEGLTYEDFKKAMKSNPEGYAQLNDEYKKTMMDVINDPATRELQQRYPHFDIYRDINGNSLSSSSLRMIDETPNRFGLGEKNLAEYYAKEHGQATAILEMSPDQYLREIHNGRKGSSKSMDAIIRQSDVKRYADMTDVGSKMPMGFIEYNNDAKPIGQEGRHRALAAERMGDEKIPVKIIYNPENPPEILKKYMNVTQDFKKAYLESRGYTYKGGTFGNRFDVVKLAEDKTNYESLQRSIDKNKKKVEELTADLEATKPTADTVNFKNLRLAMGNGGRDFEYGLRRAYLAGSDEFAKSGMMRDAAKRYRTGREAFRDGVFVAKARDALSSIPWKDTDNYVLDLFDTFENATDDYLDNLGKHAGIKKAVSTMGGAEATDVEVEYYLLKKLQANSDDAHASIQEQIRDMVKGADMSSDDVEKLIDVSNELFDDYLISRVNEDALTIRDSGGRMVDEKEAYERAKEINERIVKAQGEVDTRYSSTGMIMYVDAAGRQAFATVDPAFASLYNRRIIIEGGDASKMAQVNAVMSKTFRYGTTSVNLSSAGNQLFRDFGNAVMVGGAWRTIKAYADELEEVFGKNIVEQIKRFDPSGYEIKQLTALAEQMGVDVDKAAVSRELMRGSAVAPSSTERTLYARLWKEINNDSNIKLDAMYKKSKEILAKYNPDELINGTRENYLRKRVYAANLNEAMKAGYSVQDARIVAEFTMNNATTNFGRQLYHLQSIAESTPYFRAAINGTKSFWRMWSLDPVGISGRITGGLIFPTMYLVGASLANEEDKKVYMSIPEYQKEDSLVFVVHGEIVSIPMPQELSSIVAPFRQFVEYLNGAQENDFWELMSNDLLGFLPVDLKGFTAIDMNVMNGDPTIIDRASRGVARVFSQVAPVPLKTIYMLGTGTDPYTGKSLYDPSYWYWDDDSGSLQLMDYSQTKIGEILAKERLLGGNAAVWSKVLSGIFGNTGLDILDDLAELFTAGAEKAATKAAENALERLTSPFSVPKYNLIDSQWKAAVRSMTAKKLSIINDERVKTINSELAQTKDPEKRQKLLAERESLVGDYRKEVANMARRLTEELGGEFDRLKLAAVIQLLNFDTEPSWQAGSQESSDDATSLFYSGRDAALSMMSQMGIEASNDMSAFGYLAKDKDGNIVVKYNTPVTILDLKNTQMGLSDYHLANIKAIISQDGLYDKHEAISNQIQKIYGKGKLSNSDYQTIEAIQINWNAEVAKALAEYIDKYSAESAINNKKVRDYLKTYIEVPASWEKNNKGKRVYGQTLGDRGSLKDAYYSSWLKTMFNINDPYKGQY